MSYLESSCAQVHPGASSIGERQSHIQLAIRAQARIWFSRERLLVAILVKHGAIMKIARYYSDGENKRETGYGIIDFAGEGFSYGSADHLEPVRAGESELRAATR